MCPIKSLTVIQMIIIIILYFKELYNLGKKKKAHRTCLYAILNRGYQISSFEYHICYVNFNSCSSQGQCLGYQFLEEFKKECVNFSKAAEGFGKLLGNEIVMPELWKRRQNFEKYFFEKIKK